MKKIFKLYFILILLMMYINSCSDNSSPLESNNFFFSLTGTWKEVRLIRFDSLNVVIEDENLDSLMNRKLSFSNGNLQKLHIDTTGQFYFLLYLKYNIHNDLLHYEPDSLLSVDGLIHHWNSLDSSFIPFFPVLVYPFDSYLSFLGHNQVIETRKFSNQTLQIYWWRLSIIPTDLSSELLSIAKNNLSKINNGPKKNIYNYDEMSLHNTTSKSLGEW